jgi:antibiotic biosynthesis monooxygenase (ABM) superfamily enzyme
MSRPNTGSPAATVGAPTKHQLALMIWLAVFPTLTILNLALGDWLHTMTTVLRTFVLATIAVPIVIYALMPQLHRLRRRLLTRSLHPSSPSDLKEGTTGTAVHQVRSTWPRGSS